jgi:hypothetical protein
MTGAIDKPPPNELVPAWVGALERTCIGCGQRDNHPKYITGALNAPPIYWHHDCYVISEQPGWEDVRAMIHGAEGRTGHQLRLHLLRHAQQQKEAEEPHRHSPAGRDDK